jgi:hypothetical protein
MSAWIENPHGFKTSVCLFESSIRKPISNSLPFLKNFFERKKTKYQNLIHFLSFIQLYASLLAKDCFTKLLYSI